MVIDAMGHCKGSKPLRTMSTMTGSISYSRIWTAMVQRLSIRLPCQWMLASVLITTSRPDARATGDQWRLVQIFTSLKCCRAGLVRTIMFVDDWRNPPGSKAHEPTSIVSKIRLRSVAMRTGPIEQPFTLCAARQCDDDDVGYFSGKATSLALTIAVTKNTNVSFNLHKSASKLWRRAWKVCGVFAGTWRRIASLSQASFLIAVGQRVRLG